LWANGARRLASHVRSTLISVRIAEGKPDEAFAVAYDVLDGTRVLGSYLVVQQLGELDQLLVPYRRSHDVTTFLGRLRQELRERRWLAAWLPGVDSDTNAGRHEF